MTPEVGKSTSNHSVHSHLGWQAVVLWLVVASVDDVILGDVSVLCVVTLLCEAGRVLTEAVPAVPTGVPVVGRVVVMPPVVP